MNRSNLGFTIVELMVGIGVSSILIVSIVAMFAVFLQQGPRTQMRNEMATNLQNALERINDDVRKGTNIAVYNTIADPNAPTSLMGEYANVPGPDSDPSNNHTWRIGSNRLIINQTPVDSAGNPIYTDADYAAGSKNTIIYYVYNNALYRRTVAVPTSVYPNNVASTTTCSRVPQGGCQGSDIKVLDNLKASLGADSFKVLYYNVGGGEIQNTKLSEDGPVPDYTGFIQARAVAVSLTTQSGPVAGGEPIELANSMRMQIRGSFNTVPPEEPAPPVPSINIGEPGVMAGPGGLIMRTFGHVAGGDVYVMGQIRSSEFGSIGGNSSAGGSPPSSGAGANVFAANIACGTTDFPKYCTGQQPVSMTGSYSGVYGAVCATGQTVSTGIVAFGGLQGLRLGCEAPTVNLPAFNKAEFVGRMTGGTAAGSSVSCSNQWQTTTLAKNMTYTGDVSSNSNCKQRLEGSVYIKGNLTLGERTVLTVSDSVGAVRPVVVVNGRIDARVLASIVPNSQGTTPYFISFFSSDSTCSNSDSCTATTPAKLKETLDSYQGSSCMAGLACGAAPPIRISQVSASGSTFYGYFGEVYMENYATVGAVSGQRIWVSNTNIMMNAGL